MSAANDLIAAFSVDALAGTPGASDRASAAIDDYLFEHRYSPLGATAALYELRDKFDAMRIDSAAARAISDEIDGRIRRIAEQMIAGASRPTHAQIESSAA